MPVANLPFTNAQPILGTVARRTREAGGLLEVSLGELRDEAGYHKLGRWVLEEIREHLQKSKLGVFPANRLDPNENTEPRQWQKVWVYLRDDSTLARVIDAVLEPDKHNVRAALMGVALGDPEEMTADQKLDRIREIVAG
jgi:hypothetical protein